MNITTNNDGLNGTINDIFNDTKSYNKMETDSVNMSILNTTFDGNQTDTSRNDLSLLLSKPDPRTNDTNDYNISDVDDSELKSNEHRHHKSIYDSTRKSRKHKRGKYVKMLNNHKNRELTRFNFIKVKAPSVGNNGDEIVRRRWNLTELIHLKVLYIGLDDVYYDDGFRINRLICYQRFETGMDYVIVIIKHSLIYNLRINVGDFMNIYNPYSIHKRITNDGNSINVYTNVIYVCKAMPVEVPHYEMYANTLNWSELDKHLNAKEYQYVNQDKTLNDNNEVNDSDAEMKNKSDNDDTNDDAWFENASFQDYSALDQACSAVIAKTKYMDINEIKNYETECINIQGIIQRIYVPYDVQRLLQMNTNIDEITFDLYKKLYLKMLVQDSNHECCLIDISLEDLYPIFSDVNWNQFFNNLYSC